MTCAVRNWIAAGVLLVVGASGAVAQQPGTPAPEIELKTLDGTEIRLSEFRGHPAIVVFWTTWCPSCREEFPALVAAQERHREAGLKVLGVNGLDQERRRSDVETFIAETGATFPVVLDARGRYRRAYRLFGQPTTLFIDAAGVIRKVVTGPVSPAQLEQGLTEILTPAAGRPA